MNRKPTTATTITNRILGLIDSLGYAKINAVLFGAIAQELEAQGRIKTEKQGDFLICEKP